MNDSGADVELKGFYSDSNQTEQNWGWKQTGSEGSEQQDCSMEGHGQTRVATLMTGQGSAELGSTFIQGLSTKQTRGNLVHHTTAAMRGKTNASQACLIRATLGRKQEGQVGRV